MKQILLSLLIVMIAHGCSQETTTTNEPEEQSGLAECNTFAETLCAPQAVHKGVRSHITPISGSISAEEASQRKRLLEITDFSKGVKISESLTCQFKCIEEEEAFTNECLTDDDCEGGTFCRNMQCTFWDSCDSNADCPQELQCQDGVCLDICMDFLDCAVSPYAHPRWCQGHVAYAYIKDGDCSVAQRACDFSDSLVTVDCASRQQHCSADRCVNIDQAHPELDSGLTRIAAGTFTMGSHQTSPSPHERAHQVTLTHPIWAHTAEVTQGQWFARMRTFPTEQFACGADCPISAVSWWDALAYANQLSVDQGLSPCFDLQGCNDLPYGQGFSCQSMTVLAPDNDPYQCDGYRLPTEAEWEFLARAGTLADTWAGDLPAQSTCAQPAPPLHDIAWFAHNALANHAGCRQDPSCGPQACLGLQTIRTRQPNPWGLFDTLGNVAEWTLDSLSDDLQDSTDPWHYDPTQPIATRGGAWDSAPQDLRVSARTPRSPTHTASNLGFRLVRTARSLHTCQQDADCPTETTCEQGRCAPLHCRDGLFDPQQETGLDCGLDCPPCPAGSPCLSDADCNPQHHCDRLYCSPERFSLIPPGAVTPIKYLSEPLYQEKPYWIERQESKRANERSEEIKRRESGGHMRVNEALYVSNKKSAMSNIEQCYIQKTNNIPHQENNTEEYIEPVLMTESICLGYHIPSNLEWEYAARSGSEKEGLLQELTTDTKDLYLMTWNAFNTRTSFHFTQQKLPNFFNLYDIQGKRTEWATTIQTNKYAYVLKGGDTTFNLSPIQRMEFHITESRQDGLLSTIRLARRLPPVIECGEGCAERGCQESPHRTWISDAVAALAQGPDGLALYQRQEDAAPTLASTAADRASLPASLRRWRLGQDEHLLLQQDGRLWRLQACEQPSPEATQIAENIQEFQQTEDALYLLDTQGRLTVSADPAQPQPAPLALNLRAFAVVGQTLWTLDQGGALWSQPLDQSSPAQRRYEGIAHIAPDEGDADALLMLGQRGCLWRLDPRRRRALDAHVRAFATSQDRLYTLHQDNHLWLQHAQQGHCPPEGCPAPQRDAALSCLQRSPLHNP